MGDRMKVYAEIGEEGDGTPIYIVFGEEDSGEVQTTPPISGEAEAEVEVPRVLDHVLDADTSIDKDKGDSQ